MQSRSNGAWHYAYSSLFSLFLLIHPLRADAHAQAHQPRRKLIMSISLFFGRDGILGSDQISYGPLAAAIPKLMSDHRGSECHCRHGGRMCASLYRVDNVRVVLLAPPAHSVSAIDS